MRDRHAGNPGSAAGRLRALPILPFVAALWLSSCDSGREPGGAAEARIRREVEQRVEAIRGEMKVSETRWRTARVVAFCLLAGGSLILLFQGGGDSATESRHPFPGDGRGRGHDGRRRVIERPYQDEDECEPYPYRR